MIVELDEARAADAQRVSAALAGNQDSFGELFNEYFDRTYDVAFRIVRNREVAAEVAQDTFLAAWTGLSSLEDPASFGGWVLRISRNRALNRLSRERRSVALGDEVTTAVLDQDAPMPEMEANVAAAESRDLVWAASAALGERDASVLDLHLRHGLSGAALAEELGVNPNNANQILHAMKGRLEGAVRAFVLWRNGNPDCSDLRGVLARHSEAGFGVATARLIRRHLKACGLCEAEQQRHLAPAAMFSAVPMLVAPMALRTQAAGALMNSGVPMGSAMSPPPPPGPTSGGGSQGTTPTVSGGPDAVTGAMQAVSGPSAAEGQATQPEAYSQSASDGAPGDPAGDAADDDDVGGSRRKKVIAMVGGTAVLLLLLLGGWALLGAGNTPRSPVVARPSTTTSPATTSTSTSSSTTSTSSTSVPATTAPGPTQPPTPATVEDVPTTQPPVSDEPTPGPPVPTPDPTTAPPRPNDPGPSITRPPVDETVTVVDPPDVTKPTDTTAEIPRDPKNPSGNDGPPGGAPTGGSPTDGSPAGPF